ncbi:MAG: glycosyltransferase family 2 protein [Coprobacillus cateniformis]
MENIISVIVPIYNVEAYLPRCIESLINQTLQEIEIILVNDGSWIIAIYHYIMLCILIKLYL